MKYQTYPAYKDSGVEWLGDVPEHWEVWKLSHAFEQIGSGTTPKSDAIQYYEGGTIAWVNTGDLNDGELFDCEKKVTELALKDCSSLKIFPENSLVIAMYGATIGKLALLRFDATVNQACCVFCDGSYIQSRFLFYAFIGVRQHIVSLATGGGQPNISQDILRSLKLSAPEQTEQQKIAQFLDHETAKIDTLIEKQQRLIELLKEKRQAVISHAVTKGLNPNAPMKDSCVEWLGEVPEHWEVTKAKFLFEFITSGSRGWAEYYSDDGALFFRITNLTRDTIEPKLESIQNVTIPSSGEGERAKINKNDLLISITADLGSVCVANDDIAGGYVSQHVSLCRPNKNVASSRWLGFYILSDIAKEQFLGSGYGGTKIQLSLEDIRELLIVKPVEKEQIKIADYIDSKNLKFASLIESANSAIELMQERRTALISAAVTGKIDVREWSEKQ